MSQQSTPELVASARCFGGNQNRYKHHAEVLGCDMHFSVFLPSCARAAPVPIVYFLSGLTCTDENFVQKAGAQRFAEQLGVALIAPDTSPRGEDVPDDREGAWDFGLGAGFYVNATQEPWRRHYQMYEYIVAELPACLDAIDEVDTERAAITGHSMGGHGALTIALKNPNRYASVSAFAPIVAPMQCPWGEKALGHYLGEDRRAWEDYDTCALISAQTQALPMLVDQGEDDNFLEEQLKTELLQEACIRQGFDAQINMQPGYDHSYFFISTFIESHLQFHARYLNA